MRIIVLLKNIKYVYAQTGADPNQNNIGPDDIVNIINPLDELAIEEALRIKDGDSNSEVIVFSLGDDTAEEGLRRSLAMGADKAVHICYQKYEELDSWATATVLFHAIQNYGFKLILCGKEAMDDNNGLVGPYIAGMLDIPHITRVVRLEMRKDEGKIVVHRGLERGNRAVMECTIPALLTIERGSNVPRFPTLPGILRAQNQRVEKLDMDDLRLFARSFGPALNLTRTINVSRPKPKKETGDVVDSTISAADRLKLLMMGGESQRKKEGNLLEGSSDEVVHEIERVLKESGIMLN